MAERRAHLPGRQPSVEHPQPWDKIPSGLRPMKPSELHYIPNKPGWFMEPKYDGWRILAVKEGEHLKLLSAGGHSYNEWFGQVAAELAVLGDVVLDGELIVIDQEGRHHHGAVPSAKARAAGTVRYIVFDALHYDGEDLTGETLQDRREYIPEILRPISGVHIQLIEHEIAEGIQSATQFYVGAKTRGEEGIVMKDPLGRYRPDTKTRSWYKIKRLDQK